ncbi:glycosyltransferase family 4 protein [Oceanobacter mangrovi]|uniref:glycosyltransferase family 4 protein n=1 Tax=Oceanobacter mangrovi TaxID=2862510 RepID=UPI001C8D92D6|nr:glycosyltransferase family 4 protein [Oceanobacter mangrovi]
MRILVVHNKYKIRGGEDSVFENEVELLRSAGHDVETYVVDNERVKGLFSRILTAFSCVFSPSEFFRIRRVIKFFQPDVVHVHNYFPLISPAVFYACSSFSVPVVHTLHNFRAICPTALLSLDGMVNESSIYDGPWWAVKRRVYQGSAIGTFFLALMISFHRTLGTWEKRVDVFIALTEFNKIKYVQAGWPEEKIYIKPNFSIGPGGDFPERQSYALYVGRLSEEKGIPFIVSAFRENPRLNLKIIGCGPLEMLVSGKEKNIEYLGERSRDEVTDYMKSASCLVMASTWYEGFPMVIVEALSCGLPVVVPQRGNMSGVIKNGVTGLHYKPEDRDSFISEVSEVLSNIELRDELSKSALEEYRCQYTTSQNLESLESIYKVAITRSREHYES